MERSIYRRSETPFMFPPNSKNIPAAPVLKAGDRVRVRGREWVGVGRVLALDADERLVWLSFGGMDGWWARMDLVKINPSVE